MDTNPKYIIKDEIGELVVTRSDIAQKIVNSQKMSDEEFETAIASWLLKHNARLLLSTPPFKETNTND